MGSAGLQSQTWRIFGFHCSVSDFGTFLCSTACGYRCDACYTCTVYHVLWHGDAIAFSLLLPEARCFATIGRDSLVFYALNDLALKMVKFVLFSAVGIPVASLPLGGQLLVGFLTLIAAIAVCYVLDIFIQRHTRWAIGDFNSVRHA